MNIIPVTFGKKLQTRARQSTLLKMENFLELRDFIAENEEKIDHLGWMKFYEEAADWMDYDPKTVSDGLRAIRNYPDDKIKEWIKGGLSFDHIEKANDLQNEPTCKYDAAQLLDAAILFGNENGKRMTVREMTAFALGEKDGQTSPNYGILKTLNRWIAELPRRFTWSAEKVTRFTALIDEIKGMLTND